MQKHTKIRKEVKAIMNDFILSDWVEHPKCQTYVRWGTLATSFILLTSINLFTLAWLKIKFGNQLSTDHLLGTCGLIEVGLFAFFAYQTPLRKYFTESTNRIKWE